MKLIFHTLGLFLFSLVFQLGVLGITIINISRIMTKVITQSNEKNKFLNALNYKISKNLWLRIEIVNLMQK